MGAGWLENVRNETVRTASVFLVWFSEDGYQGGFFDWNSVTVGGYHATQKGDQACPISERQS